jgi:hypothetical protein
LMLEDCISRFKFVLELLMCCSFLVLDLAPPLNHIRSPLLVPPQPRIPIFMPAPAPRAFIQKATVYAASPMGTAGVALIYKVGTVPPAP